MVYKVMIVEDEILVRMGLKNSINWDKFNMFVSSQAANGQKAWEDFQKERPDVVITDLRMPILDGMTLIKKIRDIDKDCRIIIITCVEEFENARKAIIYGVSDYILKLTMTWDDIEGVLSRVRGELDSMNTKKSESNDTGYLIEKEKENLVNFLMGCETFNQNEFARKVDELKLRIKPDNLIVCLMYINRDNVFSKASGMEHKRITNLSICNIISEEFKRMESGEVFYENDHRYIMILNVSEADPYLKQVNSECWKDDMREELIHIEKVINMYLNFPVIFGVSSKGNGFNSLRNLYGEALGTLNDRFFHSKEKVFFYSKALNSEKSYADMSQQIVQIVTSNKYAEELMKNELESLEGKISAFFSLHQFNAENVRKFFYELAHWPNSISNLSGEVADSAEYSYMSDIFKCDSMDGMVEAYARYLNNISKIKMEISNYSRELSGVLSYINKHYSENIMLGDLAKRVNLSEGYLCTLFKKEMGTNFTDYLQRIRVDKSKELLVSSYLHLYEISESVGFSDYSYFSRVFKKSVGMGPQKFREKWGYTVVEDKPNENI